MRLGPKIAKYLKPVIHVDGHVRALLARRNLEGSILGTLNYLIKAVDDTEIYCTN